MEIRRLKFSEFDKLIEAIRRLWNPNHVYCRNTELLKYMVYNTPYRKEFCGNDEDTTEYVAFDGDKIVAIYGLIPLEGNVFGTTVMSGTATILKADPQYNCVGVSILQQGLKFKPDVFVGLGMNTKVMRLYNILGWDMFNDMPRWIWSNNFNKLKSVFNIPNYSNINCLDREKFNYILSDTVYINHINENKWNNFYNDEFAPKTIGVKKDYKYLKWRYINYPFFDYKLLGIKDENGNYKGLAVYRIEKILDGQYNIGRILEFIYTDIDYGIKLAAKLQTIKEDILFWDFYCLSSITALALERCGFIRMDSDEKKRFIPTRFQPIDYEVMNIKGGIMLSKKVKNLMNLVCDKQLYITIGDGDQDRPN